MTPTIDALVPVKEFGRAKERLRQLLAAPERAALARAMYLDMLDALRQTPALRRVFVVSASEEALQRAADVGCTPVPEPPGLQGLNAALEAGRRAVVASPEPPEALLVVPADVPAATSQAFTRFVAAAGASALVRVCPAPDGGTNALLLSPPNAIPFRYGRDSAAKHLREAAKRGLAGETVRLTELETDLDVPADVRRWLASHPSGRTAEILRGFVRS